MKKKIIIGVIVFIIVIGVIGALAGGDTDTPSQQQANTNNNESQQSQPEQTQQQAAMEVVAADLIAEFDSNQLAAEEKYKGKQVKFSAKVANISEDILGAPFLSLEPESAEEYYFGTTIKCDFKEKSELTSLSKGQTATVEGKLDTQSLGIITIKDCKIVQ